jgi:hypothetical protein
MIQVRRLGTHKYVISDARRFRIDKTSGELAVWWRDGTSTVHPQGSYEFIDERRQ